MAHWKKLVLGGLTVWPFVYALLFIGFWFFSFFSVMATGGGQEPPALWVGSFGVIFALHGLTMLVGFVLFAFYLWHVVQNEALDEGNKRVLWVLLVIMAGPIGQALYWHQYIWKHEPTPTAHGGGTLGADGQL